MKGLSPLAMNCSNHFDKKSCLIFAIAVFFWNSCGCLSCYRECYYEKKWCSPVSAMVDRTAATPSSNVCPTDFFTKYFFQCFFFQAKCFFFKKWSLVWKGHNMNLKPVFVYMKIFFWGKKVGRVSDLPTEKKLGSTHVRRRMMRKPQVLR